MFKPKKDIQFKKKVTVRFPDDSTGTLDVTYRTVSQDRLDDLLEGPDVELVEAVMVSPGQVAGEGDQALPEDEAIEVILNDACCVPAIAAEYLDEVKGKNFRRGKSRKRG